MKTYDINELIHMNRLTIMQLPKGKITIRFADGDLETTSRRTILSWFVWKLLRTFPITVGIPKSLHIGNGRLKKGDELKFCERVIWFVHRHSKSYREELEQMELGKEPLERVIWRIAEASYQAINDIHNFTVTDISHYGTTSDMEDLMQICMSPTVLDVKARLLRGEIDFPEANEIVAEYITSDREELRYNGMAMMARAHLLSSKQLYQMVLARAHAEAVNGEVYPKPIYNSYTEGMNNLYYSMTESQSASKALYMNDGPLKQSEYLNRRLQLLVSIVHSVRGRDCGNRRTMSWLVDPDDHKALEGRFHFVDMGGNPYCPEGGEAYQLIDTYRPEGMQSVNMHGDKPSCQLVPYDGDPRWEGQVIYLRSITHCINHDPSTVCEVCMGPTSKAFAPRTNIGHFLAIGPISQLSQLILSTKHVDTSTGSDYLYLTDAAKAWIRLDTNNPSEVMLKRTNTTGNYRLRVARREFYGLNTVVHAQHPDELMPQRLSTITELQLADLDPQGAVKRDYVTIPTVVGGAGAALSKEVIRAVKTAGWREVGDAVEIDLIDFKGNCLLITPSRTEDMLTYQSRVKRFLFGSVSKKDAKGDCIAAYDATGPAVAALFRLLKEKVNNLSLLQAEIFVKSCMTVDGPRGNYNLPCGGDPFIFMPVHPILTNRCISAALAYQGQKKMIMSPSTYINHNRLDHVLDPLI